MNTHKFLCFLFFVVSSVFYRAEVLARCGPGYIRVFPEAGQISENSAFIVEWSGVGARKLFEKFDENTAHLIDVKTQKKIPLVPMEKFQGQMRVYLVVLEPKEPLELKASYQIQINEEVNGKNVFYESQWVARKYKDFQWQVVKKNKVLSLTETLKPLLLAKQSHYALGCGPVSFVQVDLNLNDELKALPFVHVEVRELNGVYDERVVALQPLEKNKNLRIGHGMCEGWFRFRPDVQYEAEITFVDDQGQLIMDTTRTITFDSPVRK